MSTSYEDPIFADQCDLTRALADARDKLNQMAFEIHGLTAERNRLKAQVEAVREVLRRTDNVVGPHPWLWRDMREWSCKALGPRPGPTLRERLEKVVANWRTIKLRLESPCGGAILDDCIRQAEAALEAGL